jgi:hypothetical protein
VPFPVVDVSAWQVMELEATGQNRHPWLRDDQAGEAWLFKPVVVKNGHRQGEDWSEKLASLVGNALGVPCADIELARRGSDEGCISRDLKPRHGWQLQTGALLLTDVIPGYVSQDVRRRGHNLENVRTALEGVAPPPSFDGPAMPAFDVFAGYLVLDAIIANQDRHDENWAVLRPPPGQGVDRLCGSYDHSSSLGFNLRDEERRQRLDQDQLDLWVGRGRATRFDWSQVEQPQSLVDLALAALDLASPAGRQHWLDAVGALTTKDLRPAAVEIPTMSELAVTFALEVVERNRRRVSDG